MLRSIPNRAAVEDGGYQLIRQKENEFFTDYDLTSDALRLTRATSSGKPLGIQFITKLCLSNYTDEFRSPPNGYRGATPLYYGWYKTAASILVIYSSEFSAVSHYTLGVHHSPVCALDGREWRAVLPDAASRKHTFYRLHSLYKSLGPTIRQRHIEDACGRLQNGHEVADCGDIIFFPYGVTFYQLKPGFFAALFGKRDTFHCKYEDVIVKHTGDAYFPEHVTVEFRGHPNAKFVFAANSDQYSPFLIGPIIEMMTTGKGAHPQHKVQSTQTIVERLKVLDELLSAGAITPSEHTQKRRNILEGL